MSIKEQVWINIPAGHTNADLTRDQNEGEKIVINITMSGMSNSGNVVHW